MSQLKISQVTVKGKIIGFPWDSPPKVLFYRNDLFEAAGIDASTITKWDEYLAAAKIQNEKTA